MPRREQIEKLLESDPDDPFLNYALAMALMTEEKVELAIPQFRRVLALDAGHSAGYFQLGQALARQGDLDEARSVIRDGIRAAAKSGDQHAEAEMTAFLDTL